MVSFVATLTGHHLGLLVGQTTYLTETAIDALPAGPDVRQEGQADAAAVVVLTAAGAHHQVRDVAHAVAGHAFYPLLRVVYWTERKEFRMMLACQFFFFFSFMKELTYQGNLPCVRTTNQ